MCELVRTPDELDARTQRSLFTWACRAGDDTVLAHLAARSDIDADLDAEIAEISTAKVRSAWLTNPNRDIDDVVSVLGRDTRETVLRSVISTLGLPAEVYAAILDRTSAARTICDVACADHIPPTVRHQALVALNDADGGLDSKRLADLHHYIGLDADARSVVFEASMREHLRNKAFDSAGDDELTAHASRLWEFLVTGPLVAARGADATATVSKVAAALRSGSRLVDADPDLEDRIDDVAASAQAIIDASSSASKYALSNAASAYMEFMNRARFDGRTAREILALCADPATAPEAVAVLCASEPASSASARARLARTVLTTLELPDWLICKLISAHRELVPLLTTEQLSVDVAVRAAQKTWSSAAIDILERSREPRAALEAYLSHKDTPVSSVTAFFARATLEDLALVDVLPAGLLTAPSRADEGVQEVRRAAAHRLFEELGDDPEQWRLVEEVADGFAGSIGDLLATVHVAAARS